MLQTAGDDRRAIRLQDATRGRWWAGRWGTSCPHPDRPTTIRADLNLGRNPMHAVVVAVLSSGLVVADVPLPEEAAVEDRTELQGDWEWVGGCWNGDDWLAEKSDGDLLRFEDGRCVWSSHRRILLDGPFDLDPSESHAGIIIHWGSRSHVLNGIYRVHGDWMDLALVANAHRPTQFVSENGSNVIQWRLHRVKK